MAACELTGKQLQALQSTVVMVLGPGGPQAALDGASITLGQVPHDVALLVADAALHRGVFAKNVADRLAQGLCAVDDAQD